MLHFSRILILQIHCIVGAKSSKTGIPCFTARSSLFFAGIKVICKENYLNIVTEFFLLLKKTRLKRNVFQLHLRYLIQL